MKRKNMNRQEGVIALEACLCLTLFMFFVLFLYSFFAIFEAQAKVHHTLLQASQSMSLDAIATSRLTGDFSDMYKIASVVGFNASNKNPHFVSTERWNLDSNKVADVGKERFVAYLTSGDYDKADELLKKYRIKDGLSGLDFSASAKDDSGNINLKVTYSIEYLFDYKAFDMDAMNITSSASSHIWQ